MGRTFLRIILVAALAGLVAGAVASAMQWGRVVPRIIEAEIFESATIARDAGPEADRESWVPDEGFERGFFTTIFNLLEGVGAGLLLAIGIHLTGGSDWRRGLAWGACGFLTFTLAPSLGLPLELPGVELAPLADRQIWWYATVAATGGGLALIVRVRRAWAIGLGVAMIVLPHVVGAPQPEHYVGVVHDAPALAFAASAVATNLVFWLVLGGVAGFLYRRL